MKQPKQNRDSQSRERNSMRRFSEEHNPRTQRTAYYDARSEGRYYDEDRYYDRRDHDIRYYEGDPYSRGNTHYADEHNERYYNDLNRNQYRNDSDGHGRGYSYGDRDANRGINGRGGRTSHNRPSSYQGYENRDGNQYFYGNEQDRRGRDERVYQGQSPYYRDQDERYYNDKDHDQNSRNGRRGVGAVRGNDDGGKANNGNKKYSRNASSRSNGQKNTKGKRKQKSSSRSSNQYSTSAISDKKGKDLLAV